jgi:hypothetical protein
MLNFRKNLAIMIVCIIATKSFAQTNDYHPAKIGPAALRSDFQLLRDSLEKIHPGVYRYSSKARIDHIFDSCYASIKDSQSVTSYYGVISYVMASIGDGHANCRLPKPFVNDYLTHVKVFPAMVLFIHNRAFIFCCKQEDQLTGAELLSINGSSMETITQHLFRYVTTDGTIQSRKNWEIPEFFHFDGRSFSGAAEFAAVAKSENRGLFIGEETGGGYYGNTSGGEVDVILPASQISCRIPMINYWMAVKRTSLPDRGVLPDYPAYPTIYDLLKKTDGQMDFALKIAGRK